VARLVTLVTGPPCSGKTTFVDQRRRAGDLVADFDAVARDLGSPGKWMQSPRVGDAAEREMARLIDVASAMADGRAWIIRCAPDPGQRLGLARRLCADRVVVLKPPLGVLQERAEARPLPEETRRAIWRWFDRYGPAAGDDLILGGSGALARP
jgi:predicted kinase